MRGTVGLRYSKVTLVDKVIVEQTNGRKRTYWNFICDCGNLGKASLYDLKSGKIQSCGCVKKETNRSRLGAKLTGLVFGKLTVMEDTGLSNKKTNGATKLWKCVCSCGNIAMVNTNALTSGNTKSCGCLFIEHTKNYILTPKIQEKMQATILDRYGVLHGMQNATIALKAAKTSNLIYEVPHWKTKKPVYCQGSYERVVAGYLNVNKIDYQSQVVFPLADGSTYRADYVIDGTILEVKGYLRPDAKDKWELVNAQYPNNIMWNKSEILELRKEIGRDLSFVKYWDWSELIGPATKDLLSYPGLHVFPHEKSRMESFLKSQTKQNTTIVACRDCVIEEIDTKTARNFIDLYHIQGSSLRSVFAYGAYYNGQLVAAATFSKHHRNNTDWVLERFCCKEDWTIRGFLGKVSKLATNKLKCDIYSWADRRFSNGTGYLAAGWQIDEIIKPDYFYVNLETNEIISKQMRKKSNVNTPEHLTEDQHAIMDNLIKIFDCGKITLKYRYKA